MCVNKIWTYVLSVAIAYIATAISLQAQEVVLNGTLGGNGAVVTINGKHQVLRIGKKSTEGVKLLEVNKQSAVFEIDGERVELDIDKNYSANDKAASVKPIVRIPTGEGGHYFTPGRINGQAVNFLVDTGATTIAMNLHAAKRLGINYRAGYRTNITTASGEAAAYVVTLNRVSVGTVELNNVEATVSIGDYPQIILLGNSYLSRVDMRRENGVLVLEAMY